MKPGRELDAKVAEKVMGWDHVHCYPGGNICFGRPDDDYRRDYPNNVAYAKRVLAYSTDIAVAFTVNKPSWLWEFQETPGTLTVTLYTSFTLRRKAIEMYPILPKDVVLIRREWLDDKAATYAWLRCLAALEAAGMEVEDAR